MSVFKGLVLQLWFDVDFQGNTTSASPASGMKRLWFDVDFQGNTTI